MKHENTGGKPSIFKKLVVTVLSIAVVGGLALMAYTNRNLILSYLPFLKTNSYSKDQQKVVDAIGLPHSYTIVMVPGEARQEIWQYPLIDEIFTFSDGSFESRTHKKFGLSENPNLLYAKIEPYIFYSAQTLSDIERVVGVEAYVSSKIDSGLLENATVHNFGNLVSVGTQDDKVVFVKTMMYQDTGEEIPKPTNAPTNETDDDDNEWMTGRVFSMDGIFSVFVDTEFQNNIYSTLDFDEGRRIHVFCFRGSQNSEGSPCEGTGSPIFSIAEYTKAQYDEILESPYAEAYVKVGEKDGTIYVFSHPNGDMPIELQGKINTIYDYVIESFMMGEPS